jgi:hypothetical protein
MKANEILQLLIIMEDNMNRRSLFLKVALCIFSVSPVVSFAQEEPNKQLEFTVGLKAWNTSWQSYLPAIIVGTTPRGLPAASELINSVEGSTEVAALPTMTLRYARYFLSAGYAQYSANFDLSQSPVAVNNGENIFSSRRDHIRRREVDVNFGYFVLPGLALTVGYKGARENRDTRTGVVPDTAFGLLSGKFDAVLLGALGSYEIVPGFSGYGQFGYGIGRGKVTYGQASPAPGDQFRNNPRYILTEVGVAYQLPITSRWIQRTSVALGYRSQTVKQKVPSLVGGEEREVRDVKDGIVLSLNATF